MESDGERRTVCRNEMYGAVGEVDGEREVENGLQKKNGRREEEKWVVDGGFLMRLGSWGW